MEEQEYTGYWWLPSNSERDEEQVGGTLTISEHNRITLSLLSPLGERTTSSRQRKSHSLILGLPKKGKPITLMDCWLTGTNMQFHSGIGGIYGEEYQAELALIGTHLQNPAQFRLTNVCVEYSHLLDWGGQGRYDTRMLEDRFEVTYPYPKAIETVTNEGKLRLEHTLDTHESVSGLLQLQQKSRLRVEPRDCLTFHDAMGRIIEPFRNLLSLGIGVPNVIARISSQLEPETFPVEIITRTRYDKPAGHRPVHPNDILFTLRDLAASLDEALNRWFVIHDELDSVCDLFFSTWYSPSYIGQVFLNFVQALESYHRRRVGGTDLPETKHQERMSAILAQTPHDYQGWLKWKLKYSNEPSMPRRLEALLGEAETIMLPLIGEKCSFIRRVSDTRNYLTHYDLELQNKAAYGAELYNLTTALRFLITTYLLRELGFSIDQCASLLRKCHRYQWAVERVCR